MSDQIKQELLECQRDGIIQARDVLEWARIHPRSALHASIEWDKDKASLEYQLYQVRKLIAVHVVNVKQERQVLHLTIDREGGYREVKTILAEPVLRANLVQDAIVELKRIRARFKPMSLHELDEVWEAIDKLGDLPAPKNGRQKVKANHCRNHHP